MLAIMQILNKQEIINNKIARQVPAIIQKSIQEEPKKTKRKGILGLFGKKEKKKPTATTAMLHTLNQDIISQQRLQSRRLSEYADSL
ncbi:hybrid sensor histidine kinase/response regulator, partial [Acinetobacter baumannii]